MFFVSDTLESRQIKVRSFLNDEPAIAVLLAAADFEWTVRRAILLLGKDPNVEIRESDLHRAAGFWRYETAWEAQVTPTYGKSLSEALGLCDDDLEFFKTEAIQLRHDLIHGVTGAVARKHATKCVESILAATKSVVEFVVDQNKDVYARLEIRRRKAVSK